MENQFAIRDREAGNEICFCDSLATARLTVKDFENQDKKDGIFTENFYEIYDLKNEKIIF